MVLLLFSTEARLTAYFVFRLDELSSKMLVQDPYCYMYIYILYTYIFIHTHRHIHTDTDTETQRQTDRHTNKTKVL